MFGDGKAIVKAATIEIQVSCYAGYRGEQTPRRLQLGSRRIQVLRVLDQWLAPDHRYFKLRGDDSADYIIRHDMTSMRWELIFYHRTPSGSHEAMAV